MAINMYLESTDFFLPEIVGHSNYRLEAVPYKGLLKRHPYDEKKVLLYSEPKPARIFEFYIDNILHIDVEKSITTKDGLTVRELTVWVKKGCMAVELKPFLVGEL